MPERSIGAFNSALETGVRTLATLVACYPRAHDLSRLVQYDYLVVHSADAGGPPSLHPPLPLRSGELLVRRALVESGLRLMISRSLVRREFGSLGLLYQAEDAAGAFLDMLQAGYTRELRIRASWVSSAFDSLPQADMNSLIRQIFDAWTIEFQPTQFGSQMGLFQ